MSRHAVGKHLVFLGCPHTIYAPAQKESPRVHSSFPPTKRTRGSDEAAGDGEEGGTPCSTSRGRLASPEVARRHPSRPASCTRRDRPQQLTHPPFDGSGGCSQTQGSASDPTRIESSARPPYGLAAAAEHRSERLSVQHSQLLPDCRMFLNRELRPRGANAGRCYASSRACRDVGHARE